MREIKFRAWDNVDKKMVVVNCLNWRYPSGLEVNNTNVSLPNYLMQYIGLKDKNGKEIYEGDIIKCKDRCGEYSGELYNEVVDDMCDWLCNYGYASQELLSYDEIEVIGNIYENPELLGDKK